MNLPFLIPLSNSLHAVAVSSKKILKVIPQGDRRRVTDTSHVPRKWKQFTVWEKDFLSNCGGVPKSLKPGSTVERECPEKCDEGWFKRVETVHGEAEVVHTLCLDCTKGTQTYTIPDNLELLAVSEYVSSTKGKKWTEFTAFGLLRLLNEFLEPHLTPEQIADDPYILVSRDLTPLPSVKS